MNNSNGMISLFYLWVLFCKKRKLFKINTKMEEKYSLRPCLSSKSRRKVTRNICNICLVIFNVLNVANTTNQKLKKLKK